MTEREQDMERRVEELGEEIEDVKEDWERKQEDRSIPGAQEEEVETDRQDLGEPPPAPDDAA